MRYEISMFSIKVITFVDCFTMILISMGAKSKGGDLRRLKIEKYLHIMNTVVISA